MIPQARTDALLTHEIDDETVVYDSERQTAHRLNSTTTRVWERLDGKRSVGEIAAEIECDENLVKLAVDQLAEARLLENGSPLSVSRRTALRKVAKAAVAGMVLPALASIPAPLPAAAQSSGTGSPPPANDQEDDGPAPTPRPQTPRDREAAGDRPIGDQSGSNLRVDPVRVESDQRGRRLTRGGN